ncbi:MAG: TIGR02281 family clan AA aspartic protease [Phycisphaeraceae bacterium]
MPTYRTLLPLLLLLASLATPAAADPAKTLEDAGLTKTGVEFVIAEEEEIIRARRDITTAQRDLRSAENDFRDAERKIAKAQAYIAALQREIDELDSRRLRADSQNEYARYVEAIKEKAREIEQAQQERQKFEKEQQAKIDDARAAYIETMYTWVEKAKVVTDKYEALAKNEQVTKAIEELSEQDKRRYKLGPSRRFEIIQRDLAKAAEEYQRGAVDLRKEGNVMMIDVRINGKPIRSMILDTGASSISLPFLFAKDLGIEATAGDPIVQLQMADGKIVDAHEIKLKKVQVGEFIVEDVKAFILPESLHAAPALLGNSFLSNFTYEIDPERGKLILSRLKDEDKED